MIKKPRPGRFSPGLGFTKGPKMRSLLSGLLRFDIFRDKFSILGLAICFRLS